MSERGGGVAGTGALRAWVEEAAALCAPAKVMWCDGSEAERRSLEALAVASGDLFPLDPASWPDCFYHRSAENDVARTEHLTFICSRAQADAGPTNRWMPPEEAYAKTAALLRGSMKGRTMYVLPFLMGPAGSPFAKAGVQLTDSVYVALSMRIMTRMGRPALDAIERGAAFTRCLHGKADVDEARRLICHFPEDNAVRSVGSDYGGNALLGKKCLALRIASVLGRSEGWLAEHMLILGIEDPSGRTRYVAAAFPSQCGKTNLAMLRPPAGLPGYRTWTVGDDIAWLRPGPDGRLWAVNPEAGFFGVAPGTGPDTNPNAMAMVRRDTVFTNVALTPGPGVWWEGMGPPPAEALDWRGKPWTPASGTLAAHPNSRYTTPAARCPVISPRWEDACGVPISAIFFGSRRSTLDPLVYQAFDWVHGTFVGATMGSETTAAATGRVGVLRNDPMAMLPFCGYHIGDYFAHWLDVGSKLANPPAVFHVNWFRRGPDGSFLWPGFGENLRVLLWALDRAEGKGGALRTPIGHVPAPGALGLDGLDLPSGRLEQLFAIDKKVWMAETDAQAEFFAKVGDRLPPALEEQRRRLKERLDAL